MLTQKNREPQPDPEEVLRGTCETCKLAVECERYKAQPAGKRSRGVGGGHDGGMWVELPQVECPRCAARVYLRARC